MQRFTAARPCPICGGHERLARGQGIRCAGFLSTDGRAAYCEREDRAGGLKLHEHLSPPAYLHWLTGECDCGSRHDGRLPALLTNGNGHQSAAIPTRARVVATYDYQDAEGQLAYQVDRYLPKDFRVRGGYRGERRFLYRLPQLLEADPGAVTYLCEGEKDADRLTELGLLATTNANGAQGWSAGREQYREQLSNRQVVVLVDNDAAGWKRVDMIAPDLTEAGCTVRILEFPELPGHGDVSDFLDAHSAEELAARALAAPLWQRATAAPALEWNGAELVESDEPEIESLAVFDLPNIIIKGWSHVVAAAPKAGKTTLLAHIIRGWLDDGLTALWLTEEPRSVWRRRLRRLGGDWSALTLRPGDPSQEAALRERAATGLENVVIVDTMRGFLKVDKWDDAGQVAAAMRPWVNAVSREGGKTLLLIHHSRKGGGQHGEEIANSHEIVAAVDWILSLRRHGEDEETRRRKVTAFGREFESTVFLYEMTDDGTQALRYLGEPKAVALASVKERALGVLGASGTAMTTREVRDNLDDPQPALRQVLYALTQLAETRQLQRDPPVGVKALGQAVTWRVLV